MVPKNAIAAQSRQAHGATARPVPVLVVAGFSQAARHRTVQQWLRSQPHAVSAGSGPLPADQPLLHDIAWLDHQDRVAQLSAPAPQQSFLACVCCSGSLVFTTHLTRLLREGRWRALVISLGAAALPAKLRQQLAGPDWAPHLGPLHLVSLVDALTHEVAAKPDHPLHEAARQQLDASDRLLQAGHPLPAHPWGQGH